MMRALPWLLLVILGGLVWMLLRPGANEAGRISKSDQSSRPAHTPDKASSRKAADPADVSPATRRLLIDTLARFETSTGPVESAAILQSFREAIESADGQRTAAAIVAFLQSGKDAQTRLPFAVGPGGMMETCPTFRTLLLDLLQAHDPEVALDMARAIMDAPASPDEYALALRNLAWNDLNGDLKAELATRFTRMIETEEWRTSPSAGFLEALDAGVELSDESSFSSLLRLNAEANREAGSSLARASFIALDRIALRTPDVLVKSFTADNQLAGIPPEQRASLMSRLDLTDPAQFDGFVRYLSAANHGPDELDYFAKVFPNGNYLHGNWLITSLDATGSIQSRQDADRQVLARIETLLAQDHGDAMKQTLVRIRERLSNNLPDK